MRQPNIIYGDSAMNIPTDDGVGEEGHIIFTLNDFAAIVASYGPDKPMVDLFERHPGIYAALCYHFTEKEAGIAAVH